MTGPLTPRAAPSGLGGLRARADGQQVEVRMFEGELVQIVSSPGRKYKRPSAA
jgi:hypothetical protein